jgi:soluble lytic murein transglycosylase
MVTKGFGFGWKAITGAMMCAAVAVGYAQSSSTTTSSQKKPAATASKSAGSKTSSKTTAHHTTTTHHGAATKHTAAKGAGRGKVKRKHIESAPTALSKRLHTAFVASAELRPMAQQLVLTRSAAAYEGVRRWAAGHPGDGAAAAQLALGHALMMDHQYPAAEEAFAAAKTSGDALDDYAVYLGAQAAIAADRPTDAIPALSNFAQTFPDSLFVPNAPVTLAQAYLENHDPGSALRVLQPLANTEAGGHVDFRSTLAKAYQQSGNFAEAARLYRGIYLGDPLSGQANDAKNQLAAMQIPLTIAERKQHADAMFNAHQYGDAAFEYRTLKNEQNELTQADRDALEIYAAVCDLKLKRLSRNDVEKLPVTGDDSAALKLYLQAELARNVGDETGQDALVQELMTKYPQSRWLEEALYSGGNMYLIRRDATRAIADYAALVQHFPKSVYAPSAHWRAAWLSYRTRNYPDAARLMDEQIQNYPGGQEIPGALYWRARLYEDEEHNFPQALNYYNKLNDAYVNSYYGLLARQRIAAIGKRDVAEPTTALASVREVDDPELIDQLPENDPHLIKARLLANAALNEYIRPEIALSATSSEWGALAEADIYQSFGETTRALQAMKRSKIPFFALNVDDVPHAYWEILFPRPYWATMKQDAESNGLDPYLVAALIRQESEFNAGAVSRANAVGLMQLLPSTGKGLARRDGVRHFNANELLDPTINLELGTTDLKQAISKYGGQVEYALASYNAGDSPVRQWIAANDYKDVPEWVESIPYSETRDYVQSILRNREMYRAIYAGK